MRNSLVLRNPFNCPLTPTCFSTLLVSNPPKSYPSFSAHSTMSPRRSARISSLPTTTPTTVVPEPASYEKVPGREGAKSAPASKKKKDQTRGSNKGKLERKGAAESSFALDPPSTAAPEPASYKKIPVKEPPKPAPATKKRKTQPRASPADKLAKEAAAESIFAPDPPSTTPTTPLPKRRRGNQESPAKPPPFTPTPFAVGLLAHSNADDGKEIPISDDTQDATSRPAEPHSTNAPVSTSNGSTLTAYPPVKSEPEPETSPAKRRKAKEVPPDVGVVNQPSATIDTLLRDAEAYLVEVDPKLGPLVEKHKCRVFSPEGMREVVDPFTALSSGIIGQQVSISSLGIFMDGCSGVVVHDDDPEKRSKANYT